MTDDEVIETMYEHYGVLMACARKWTSSEAEAEDIVSQTFIKGIQGIDSFSNGTNLRAWLIKICRNESMTLWAKKQRGQKAMTSYQQLKELEDPADATDPDHEEILQAMLAISNPFRDAMVLRYYYHLSYIEISHRLKCPIGTVMSKLHRGRKELAQNKEIRAIAKRRGHAGA